MTPTPSPSPAPVTWEELTWREQVVLHLVCTTARRVWNGVSGGSYVTEQRATDLWWRGLADIDPDGRIRPTSLGRSVWEEGQR